MADAIPPTEPRRPFLWPDAIRTLAGAAPAGEPLYLVGGVVRDALRGAPLHDYDLATPGDGLRVARHLADALGGAYYPVDRERRTGRAILTLDGEEVVLDVASFRGESLLDDLRGRDFTVNAMAVALDAPDVLLDPLGGQADLFDRRVLRMCAPGSIASDPIRALRAVRMALHLKLRLDAGTKQAAKAAADALTAEDGAPAQAERARDELFKLLGGPDPAAALRLLAALGLLDPLLPPALPTGEVVPRIDVAAEAQRLFSAIRATRDDNTAAELILGVAVMVLDRYRRQLQEHLALPLAGGRTMGELALLAAITPPDVRRPGELWAEHLRLSNAEAQALDRLAAARRAFPPAPVDARAAHRYYRVAGEPGIGGVLLVLAEFLSRQPHGAAPPEAWGALLEDAAAPLLDAFFRRHQQIVAPPPLLTGTDLLRTLHLKPGPHVGVILQKTLEEQAAGTLGTKEEALRYAERLAGELGTDTTGG